MGVAVAATLGLRDATGRASPWSDARFQGAGNSHLLVFVEGAESDGLPAEYEIFARLLYGTDTSSYTEGLFLRVAYAVPESDRNAVVILDLSRLQDRDAWFGGSLDHMTGRYYEVVAGGGPLRFDGEAEEGEMVLARVAVGAHEVGFRLTGQLVFTDPGEDGLVGGEDDAIRRVDLTFESFPLPEEIFPAADAPAPLPARPVCEVEYCYEDPYYGDAFVDVGCDGEIQDDGTYYAGTAGACEGDTIEDDDYTYGDSYGDDAGCESDSGPSTSDDWDAGGACDGGGGPSSDGSWDSGNSGCDSGGGCEGDTLAAAPTIRGPHRGVPPTREAVLGWMPLFLLAGLALGLTDLT